MTFDVYLFPDATYTDWFAAIVYHPTATAPAYGTLIMFGSYGANYYYADYFGTPFARDYGPLAFTPNPVAEPGTLALLGFGLAGIAALRRRKQ